MTPDDEAVLSFDANANGAMVALAVFGGILLVFVVILLFYLRREQVGPLRLTRRTRIAGFSALSVLYLATLYGWLFWRTFYELRVAPDAGVLELKVLMPERRLSWPLERIASIRRVPGSRPWLARLVVETCNGRRYRSPDEPTRDATAMLQQLEHVLTGSPLSPGARTSGAATALLGQCE